MILVIRDGKGIDIGQGSNPALSLISQAYSWVVYIIRMVECSAQLGLACSI
jgi:hypothetical protein